MFFLPQTVEQVYSKFNGEIKVVKTFGKYSVWAGGFEQSGPLVEKIWKQISRQRYEKVLILGLGCGSIIKFLPGAKITGVEIDPAMIDLGKKYFGLTGVKVIIGDATTLKFKDKYDLIVVDIYKGGQFKELIVPTRYLANDGIIIYNQLDFPKVRFDLLSSLDKDPGITIKEVKKSEYNKLIFCSKK